MYKYTNFRNVYMEINIFHFRYFILHQSLWQSGDLAELEKMSSLWMDEQLRLRTAWPSAQANQSLRCPTEILEYDYGLS